MQTWTASGSWEAEWRNPESIGGGGQGTTRKATHFETGQLACIKTLNKQKEEERRSRFFREATAYDTCQHRGVPKLIQSNALHHAVIAMNLYIATEFVPGPTLSKHIENVGPRNLHESFSVIDSLLDTISYLHGQEWIHRDIKPDNIILRNGNVATPVLVDFGIAFKDIESESSLTTIGDELGNRFLRLPELAVESARKHDPRSDLAFVGGILFFLITGRWPAQLLDADGHMPHQRPEAAATITRCGGFAVMRLLGFFDRVFSPTLEGRFRTADEMRIQLSQTLDAAQKGAGEPSERELAEVLSFIARDANQAETRRARKCDVAMDAISSVHRELGLQFQPTFVPFQTSYQREPGGLTNTLGFSHFQIAERQFSARFHIQVAGSEILVAHEGEVLYRTSEEAPEFGDGFLKQIRQIYISGVRRLISAVFDNQFCAE